MDAADSASRALPVPQDPSVMFGRVETYDVPLVVTPRDAWRYGITNHQRNTGRVESVFPGASLVPDQTRAALRPTWANAQWCQTAHRCRALQLLHPDVAADGVTAALLLGYPLPDYVESKALTVSRNATASRIRRTGVTLHRTGRYDPIEALGLRINHPLHVLTRLGPLLRTRDITAVIDTMAGTFHGPPFMTVRRIQAFVERQPRLHQRAALLTAIKSARDRVRSPQETYLRLYLVGNGLPEPTVNLEVTTGHGTTREIDLAYEEYMIAIEYHGQDFHFANARQGADDNIRRFELEQLGWTVIVVTSQYAWSRYLDQIITALRAAGWRAS